MFHAAPAQRYCEYLTLKTEMIVEYRAGIFCTSNDWTPHGHQGFDTNSQTHEDQRPSPKKAVLGRERASLTQVSEPSATGSSCPPKALVHALLWFMSSRPCPPRALPSLGHGACRPLRLGRPSSSFYSYPLTFSPCLTLHVPRRTFSNSPDEHPSPQKCSCARYTLRFAALFVGVVLQLLN